MNKKLILSSLGTFVIGVLAGGALLYNDDVYSTVKETITGEDLQNTITGITPSDLQSMELEAAKQRVVLLDKQIQTQIASVQANNERMAKLYSLLAELNQVKGSMAVNATVGEAVTSEEQSRLSQLYLSAGLTGTPKTNGEVAAQINTVRQTVDSFGFNQQSDMLKLQSLTNKRSEVFNGMTKLIIKMQESRR